RGHRLRSVVGLAQTCVHARPELGFRLACLGVVHESSVMQKHSDRIDSASAASYRNPLVRSSSFPAAAPGASSTAATAAAGAAITRGWVATRLAQAECPSAAPRVIPVRWISQDTAL